MSCSIGSDISFSLLGDMATTPAEPRGTGMRGEISHHDDVIDVCMCVFTFPVSLQAFSLDGQWWEGCREAGERWGLTDSSS